MSEITDADVLELFVGKQDIKRAIQLSDFEAIKVAVSPRIGRRYNEQFQEHKKPEWMFLTGFCHDQGRFRRIRNPQVFLEDCPVLRNRPDCFSESPAIPVKLGGRLQILLHRNIDRPRRISGGCFQYDRREKC